jgi:large repetitive protein
VRDDGKPQQCDEGKVEIRISPQNDVPVANDDSYTTNEDTPLTMDVKANDSEVDGDTLSITEFTQPQNGTVMSAEGKLLYEPAGNSNGTDTFTYGVSDGNSGKDTATVRITVNAVNDAPKAADDPYSVDEDQTLTVPDGATDLLANDSDIEGDTLTAVQEVGPAHGQLTLSPDGSFTYTPDAHYNGEVTFTYKASDGNLHSDVTTVTITVNPLNDEPVGTTDIKETPENTPLVLTQAELINNDNAGPANESSQSLTVTEVKNPTHGTVKLENAKITFTPQANYNGPASFLYTVCDDGQPQQECSTQTATVNISVSPVNSRPEAKDASFTIKEDAAPLAIDFSKLVSVVETSDSNLTYNIVVGSVKPNQGTLSGTAHRRTFDSADDFNGTLTITYTVTDRGDPDNCAATTGGGEACAGAQTSEQKKVSISVAPVNDAPVAKNDSHRFRNIGLYVPPSGVLKNDSDVDGDQRLLSARMLSKPKHGDLVLKANGSFAYRPDKNYTGRDQFTYLVSDGEGGKDKATVRLRVL